MQSDPSFRAGPMRAEAVYWLTEKTEQYSSHAADVLRLSVHILRLSVSPYRRLRLNVACGCQWWRTGEALNGPDRTIPLRAEEGRSLTPPVCVSCCCTHSSCTSSLVLVTVRSYVRHVISNHTWNFYRFLWTLIFTDWSVKYL